MLEERAKSNSEKSDKAQSSDIFWFLLLLSIGAFLRFYRLGWHSIWADEGGSILVAGMNIHSMFSFIIHQDAHPPLFFLILHGVLALGRSEFLLRVPSALFGILSLALTYGIARRLFNTVTARIALFLMAFSAAQIYITQEIRMYPYYISLSLLSTYLFLRTVEKPSWPAAALYCLSLVMTLYTPLYGCNCSFVPWSDPAGHIQRKRNFSKVPCCTDYFIYCISPMDLSHPDSAESCHHTTIPVPFIIVHACLLRLLLRLHICH